MSADPEKWARAVELLDELLQVWGGAHDQAINQSGLISVARRHHQGFSPVAKCLFSHRQNTPAGAKAAIEPQLTGAPEAVEAGAVQLATGDQQCQCNRQVEGRTLLSQVCRSQVHHHTDERASKAAVAQC